MSQDLKELHHYKVKRDKLDKKAIPGILVGYSEVSKAYKVYHPQTGKTTITRDVHFSANEQWDWKNSQKPGNCSAEANIGPLEEKNTEQWQQELEDDHPVRGRKLLSEVYQRCNVAIYEPAGPVEALQDPKWKKAMEEEISMIEKNKTWVLVDKPEDRKVIGVKWIFRTKLNAGNSINKYKSRLVVKEYAQIYGVDYSDTFSPVARLDTIRLLLVIAIQMKWKVSQLDVKSAFLKGILEEKI